MTLTIEAIYENGVLKPATPLPLKEHEQVEVIVKSKRSVTEESTGMLKWTGDAETFERILAEAEEPEDLP